MKATASEDELKDYAIEHLSDDFTHSIYLTELSYPGDWNGVCRTDLVFVQIDISKLREWLKQTNPAEETPYSNIVYEKVRDDGPMAIEELWEWSDSGYYDNFSRRLEGKHFQELHADGYLRFKNGKVDVYQPPNIVRSTIAFELKRTELETGLEQAKRNLENYANKSYVVTDSSMAQSRKKYRDDFRKSGIGLISVEEDSAETVLPATAHRKHMSEDPNRAGLNRYCYEAYTIENLDADIRYSMGWKPERMGTSF